MAAYPVSSADNRHAYRLLEDVTITNQTANTTAVTKVVKVPQWAVLATFYLFYDSSGGTSPLFDFVLGVPDFGSDAKFGAPTDDNVSLVGNQLWDGIVQVTGAGPYLIQINVGPDLTADDTGSGTADCTYDVRAFLPPWLSYTYTTDGTTDDEDYRFRIAVQFR